MQERGVLVLVVGPSGAGKDTLIAAARTALAGDDRFRFVRRAITRPADAGGEDHEPVSEAEFDQRRFALAWQAHGLRYGLPDDIVHDLRAGRIVIANVSRAVVRQAARRFPIRVIEVSAPPEVIAARLAARGRETPAEIAARLARSPLPPDEVEPRVVPNDSTREEGARKFLNALLACLPEHRS